MSWPDTQVEYERHVRRAAIVDTVEAAFAFVLTGIEEEAIELPVIAVEPVMVFDNDEDPTEGRVRFEVEVSGRHRG